MRFFFLETRHLTSVLAVVSQYRQRQGIDFDRLRNRLQNRVAARIPDRRYTINHPPIRAAAARARRILSDQAEVFCYCRRGFFGNMVACDHPRCQIIWFHTACVQIADDNIPSGAEHWFCPDCRDR